MIVENTIINWGVRISSITHVLTNRNFEWFKFHNELEVAMTESEVDLLIDWFNQYPNIFTNNLVKDFQKPLISIPPQKTPTIMSTLLKNKNHEKYHNPKPDVIYNLEFDVIGYEI